MRRYSSLSANQEAASSFKKLLKGVSEHSIIMYTTCHGLYRIILKHQPPSSSSRPNGHEEDRREGGESRKRSLDTKDDSDTEDDVRWV